MSHTNTTQLNLRKDGGDEAILDLRGVVNDNMDLIDTAYGQYLDDYEQSLENIAAIEGTTASAAHAVGTYLVQNGTLYRVTSAIAIGDTITPGTNVTVTDLNTAVTSLNTAASNLTASLAAVEQTTATANHAIGDYFMLGNVLMKATAAIATGEQISVSNATPATLQSQINSLRDSVSLIGTVTNKGTWSGDVENNSGPSTAKVSLSSGWWLIVAGAEFAKNANGRRQLKISSATGPDNCHICAASPDSITILRCTYLTQITNSTNIYAYVFQTSGTTLAVETSIQAFRVSPA